jgi:hypothetical protein
LLAVGSATIKAKHPILLSSKVKIFHKDAANSIKLI